MLASCAILEGPAIELASTQYATKGHLQMSASTLQQSALLVIDVQDSFSFDEARWSGRNNPAFEDNLVALIDAYQAANLPIIYFLHQDGDEGFHAPHPAFKLMDFVAAKRDDAPLLIKTTRNCFTSTTLGEQLAAAGVKRVVITGIQTEQCCETTARLAADLGYAVDFVVDATLTFPIVNASDPSEVLDTDAVTERTVFALRDRFARIVPTATLVDEINALS